MFLSRKTIYYCRLNYDDDESELQRLFYPEYNVQHLIYVKVFVAEECEKQPF